MKRAQALAELSREHQHALALALRAKRAANLDAAAIANLAEQCVADYGAKLAPHFEIEEEFLLPAMSAAGEAALAQRTLAEHAEIRRLVAALAQPSAAALAAFGEALGEHVRFEERGLFEVAQERLSPESLATVAAACDKG